MANSHTHPPEPGVSVSSHKRALSDDAYSIDDLEPLTKSRKFHHGQCAGKILFAEKELNKTNEPATEGSSPIKKMAPISVGSPADSAYAPSLKSLPSLKSPTWTMAQQLSISQSSGIEADISECGTPSFQNSSSSVSYGVKYNNNILQHVLQRKFVVFKDNIDAEEVADILFAKQIIDDRDVEKIREEKHRRQKVDIFIKAVGHSKAANDSNTLSIVKEALTKVKYGHLVQDFLEWKDEETNSCAFDKQEMIYRLHKNAPQIEDEVEPRLVIDEMVVNHILTLDEHECIHSTPFKPDRVKCLFKYIISKPEKKYYWFCKALGLQYPELEALLLDVESSAKKQVHEENQVQASLQHSRIVYSHIEGSDLPSSTNVKFNFSGDDPCSIREIECMIVDEQNSSPNAELIGEAMEIGSFDINGFSFSSVRINLTSLSVNAQLNFIQQCQKSPEFLKTWIHHLVSEKNLSKLKQSGTKSVSFELVSSLPKDSKVSCRSRLSKKAIVKIFSDLEKELRDVDTIIQAFIDFKALDEVSKSEMAEILLIPTRERKNEAFLRKVLSLEKYGVCLFEKVLRELHQEKLLENMLDTKTTVTSSDHVKITPKHIKRNFTFLLEELEPNKFVETLRNLQKTEEMLSTQTRKDRCKTFLDCIIKGGQSATEWFVAELERIGMTGVLEFLKTSLSPKNSTNENDLKESILEKYKNIIDEIEPRVLRSTFVERQIIKSREFDNICKSPTRRCRSILFMKRLLKKKPPALQCFLDALENSGYEYMALLIKKNMEEYRPCPCLSYVTNEKVTIKGKFDLLYQQGRIEETDLQIFLHKLIYAHTPHATEAEAGTSVIEERDGNRNGTIDKTSFTKKWLQTQQSQSDVLDKPMKRKYDELKSHPEITTQDGEGIVLSKRLCIVDVRDGLSSPSSTGSKYGVSNIRCDEALEEGSTISLSHDDVSSVRTLSLESHYEDITPPLSPMPLNPFYPMHKEIVPSREFEAVPKYFQPVSDCAHSCPTYNQHESNCFKFVSHHSINTCFTQCFPDELKCCAQLSAKTTPKCRALNGQTTLGFIFNGDYTSNGLFNGQTNSKAQSVSVSSTATTFTHHKKHPQFHNRSHSF